MRVKSSFSSIDLDDSDTKSNTRTKKIRSLYSCSSNSSKFVSRIILIE